MSDHSTVPPRRLVLLQGLALATAALAGCGGGGGGDTPVPGPQPPSPPPPPPTAASGTLAYRNSGTVGVYSFASDTEISFTPLTEPSLDPGVTVSESGSIAVALEGDNSGFGFALYGLNGTLQGQYDVARDFAFQTGAVVFNADSSRIAFSIDEETSPTNNTRITKVIVAAWPSGTIVATLDNRDEPVWALDTGELIVRDADPTKLRVYDVNLADQGPLANVVVNEAVGSFNVSADGRYVVYEDATVIRVFDRDTSTFSVAATDPNSSNLHSPTLSPDGNWLAVIARDLLNYVPHVMPFAAGTTVTVDSTTHALATNLADCAGRMGWIA
jgi:WD40 repeat protein